MPPIPIPSAVLRLELRYSLVTLPNADGTTVTYYTIEASDEHRSKRVVARSSLDWSVAEAELLFNIELAELIAYIRERHT